MDLFTIGFPVALTFDNILYCLVGVTLGMIVGVIPGIGAMMAITLLLPLTFYLEPVTALVMLGGVYYGAEYGGSTSSILLNLPGTDSGAIICLDGYPLARQGKAGIALFVRTISSFLGGCVGIVLMMTLSPVIVDVALSFGAAEYFAAVLFALVASATIAQGSPIKGLAMVVVGLMLGTVGTDLYTGANRFTFGVPDLFDGVGVVVLAMALFGITEVILSIGKTSVAGGERKIAVRSMIPGREDASRIPAATARGSAVGSFIGALPGAGPLVATLISYAMEKRVAKHPERFGKGAIEGVAGPEAANNAAVQTAFIPTMSLGIPGSPTMAIMLGALMIHGIQPGPQLIGGNPELFWGLVASFWIGNLILLILNIPLIGIWVRLMMIPYNMLFPAIITLICIGAFASQNSIFDVWAILAIGAFGFLIRYLGFEVAPLLVGFVLGPMLEENFRRAMLLARGDFTAILQRPGAGVILALTALLLLWAIFVALRPTRARSGVPHGAAGADLSDRS